MGFFDANQLAQLQVLKAQAAPPPNVVEWTPEQFARQYPHHIPAMIRGARCWECPMRGSGRGPVLGDIVPNAPMAVVGEAPGNVEISEGKVFSGPSGVELNLALSQGGLSRFHVTALNLLGCAPPPKESLSDYLTRLQKSWRRIEKRIEAEQERAKAAGLSIPVMPLRPPTPIDCCRPRLERDLMESNSKVLLAVGGYALKALAERDGHKYGRRAQREEKDEDTLAKEGSKRKSGGRKRAAVKPVDGKPVGEKKPRKPRQRKKKLGDATGVEVTV